LTRLRSATALAVLLLAAAATAQAPPTTAPAGDGYPRLRREEVESLERQDPTPASFTIPLRDRDATVRIVHTPEGVRAIVHGPRGGGVSLTPEQFPEYVYREQRDRPRFALFKVFNITGWGGVFWVGLGFLGQALFTFRMVLQWLASEKEKKSVVPVGFWWGSLLGGLMLLTYFGWRKDIVGILGQSTGAFIYARNLVLIYRERARQAAGGPGDAPAHLPTIGDDPGPEPELNA
jgi:lipid-A-disaccharide synthase-like uncharacterized protein